MFLLNYSSVLYIHKNYMKFASRDLENLISRKLIQIGINALVSNAQIILATTCDFQQCGMLTSVDSDDPVQPLFTLRNSKGCSVSS